LLHAERIGHGVRSIEDPSLVEYLHANSIPLEICPTSNICLKVFPDYAHHPLRQLWEAGLSITIGSDDPPMFGTDLNREYQILVEHFNFSKIELEQVSLNAIRTSFLSQSEKQKLEQEFQAEFAQLSQQ
jgi:adenosine deaminase